MNKAKFVKKSILFAIIGIMAFSLIPAVSAGFPGHWKKRPYWNNLVAPWFLDDYTITFSASEDLFFRIGWATSEWEIENDIYPKHPWKFKLFINDEEINLQRYGFVVDKMKVSYWYHVFKPGYFEVEGEYLLRFEFWVKRPYQGDGKNYWRVFEDYSTGWEFIAEYNLNIIA